LAQAADDVADRRPEAVETQTKASAASAVSAVSAARALHLRLLIACQVMEITCTDSSEYRPRTGASLGDIGGCAR
jgi:hypothetical protein